MGEAGAAVVGSRGGAPVQGCILAFLRVGLSSRNQWWVRLCWVVRKAPEGTALQAVGSPVPWLLLQHFPVEGTPSLALLPGAVGQAVYWVSFLPGTPQSALPALAGAWSSCAAASTGGSALPALLPSLHAVL